MRGWLIVPAKDDSATIRSVAVRIAHWWRGQTGTSKQCLKLANPETKFPTFRVPNLESSRLLYR